MRLCGYASMTVGRRCGLMADVDSRADGSASSTIKAPFSDLEIDYHTLVVSTRGIRVGAIALHENERRKKREFAFTPDGNRWALAASELRWIARFIGELNAALSE